MELVIIGLKGEHLCILKVRFCSMRDPSLPTCYLVYDCYYSNSLHEVFGLLRYITDVDCSTNAIWLSSLKIII